MTHQLTDEICEQIRDSIPKLRRDGHGHTLSHDGQRILDGMGEELAEVSNAEIRAAADWQLKQCLEFLRTHKFHERSDYFDLRYDSYANLLEDAMRPTQENN